MKLRRLLLPLLALSSRSAWAEVSVFEGLPGAVGNVLIIRPDGSDVRPAGLQGVRLLPADFVGRTALMAELQSEPRLRADVPPARILLPGEGGSLYRYCRVDAQGGPVSFGYFIVGADGTARSVFEIAGTGGSGSDDPIPGKIAVEPAGRAILVATTLAAGGDLWEIDLASGSAVNRTASLAPRSFLRNGLALLSSWGVGLSDAGPLRFARAGADQASSVPMPGPGAPAWFGPDVVRSADESTVAFIAGAGQTQALVFAFGSVGPAVQASSAPMPLSGAGFLPESATGPALALSTDGSRVAWRSEGSSRECWLGGTAAGADMHVTGDANFESTLNDTGVIAFVSQESFVFLVGKRDNQDIRKADLFRVEAAASALAITNLSGTSEDARPPFDYGRLSTRTGVCQVSGSVWLAHEEVGADDLRNGDPPARLLRIDAAAGPALELLGDVASLDLLEPAGRYVVASVHRSTAGAPLNLLQIPIAGGPTGVSQLPDGCRLTRAASLRSNDSFAAVLELASGEWLGRIRAPSPGGFLLSGSSRSFGPALGFAPDGTLLGTVDLGRAELLFAWSGTSVTVLRSGLTGFLLPGL